MIIDTDKIMDLLVTQFSLTMGQDEEYYSGYKIVLSKEQQFVKEKDRIAGAIYIVVKFLSASLNFGQSVLPITITAVSERNKLEVAQRLLLEFAQTYNLTNNDDGTIKQTYTSPSVLSNFTEVDFGFRSLLYMSGTFLISTDSNPITKLSSSASENNGTAVPIQTISVNTSFDVQLDSQAFSNTDNFTKSVGKIGTFTLNFTTYATDSTFISKVMSVVFKNNTFAPDGVNTTFKFDVELKSGLGFTETSFKLVNCTFQQNIGELPILSLTFTN